MRSSETPAETQFLLSTDWRSEPGTHHDEIAAIKAAGYRLVRESFRFEWTPDAGIPASSERLMFKTDVEPKAFVDVATRICEGTLDRAINDLIERLGIEGTASRLVAELANMHVEPGWWQIGEDANGEQVGLVLPTRGDKWSLLGLIGVVLEHRGKGYAIDLLAQGTLTLASSGASAIRGDADVQNAPMCRTFERAGYTAIGVRLSYISSP